MNHNPSVMTVSGSIHNNSLCVNCICNDDIIIDELGLAGLDDKNQSHQTYLLWWLLNVMKPFFLNLPCDQMTIDLSQECKNKFNNIFTFCYTCLHNTNNVLKQSSAFKDCAVNNEKILFYNVDDNVNFKKIYRNVHAVDNEIIVYQNFNSGFNPVERKWEKTPPPLSIEELIAHIRENRIKKIVSINHYLLEKYLEQGIYILSLFKYLGVEYVIVDLDNYDLTPQGYLFKSFYNCNDFDRFSYAEFHVYWDKYYKMKNVNRISFAHEYKKDFKFQTLDDDYDIVVMSNSRIQDVLSMLNPIIFILNHFNDESFFEEVELWYYSLRYMILSVFDLKEYERSTYNASLLRFAYAVSQFIKYDVISSIQSDRKINVYGDAGWQHIFPEHYCSYLDREGIDEVFSKGRSLNLLMNWQLTWFETSAVIYEALNYKVPFINHPALVKTSPLSHMSFLEYRNPAELNEKVGDIKKFLNEDLEGSVNYLNGICNSSMDFMAEKILNNNKALSNSNHVIKEFEAHDRLLQQRINKYIIKNEPFLRYSFNGLFIKSVNTDISQSKYFSTTFMQRLLKFAQNR